MKKILPKIGTVLAVGIFIYLFWIRPDYNWAQKIIEKKSNEDWILITQTESGEIIKPWTWFKTPITNLWFAKRNDILRIDSTIIAGHVYSISRIEEKTEGVEYFELFNKSEYGSHIVTKPDDLNSIKFEEIKWTKHRKGTPGGDLIDYFSSKNKKYTMVSVFGDVIDISNLIITGMYSSKDTVSQYIFELSNNNPYKPTIEDEKIIHEGLKNWLFHKYPMAPLNLDTNLYTKVKYFSSQLGFFDRIQDNYVIKILPFKGADSLLVEFDFERLSIPLEYQKADKIRIH